MSIENILSSSDICSLIEFEFPDAGTFCGFFKTVAENPPEDMIDAIVYSFVKTIREHPEWLNSLYSTLCGDTSGFPVYKIIQLDDRTFYRGLLIAVEKGLISPEEALKFVNHTSVRSLTACRYYPRLGYLLYGSGLDRRHFYRELSQFRETEFPSELITTMIKDYSQMDTDEQNYVLHTIYYNYHYKPLRLKIDESIASTDEYVNFLAGLTIHTLNIDNMVGDCNFLARLLGLLPKDKIPLYTRNLKNLKSELRSYLTRPTEVAGYLLGCFDNIYPEENDLNNHILLVPYIPDYRFHQIVTDIKARSACATVLLNNDAIREHREMLRALLNHYLNLKSEEQKLESHRLLLDSDIVSSLSPRKAFTLVERSVSWENGDLRAVRFSYTDDAVTVLKTKLTSFLVTSGSNYNKTVFSDFISLYPNDRNRTTTESAV